MKILMLGQDSVAIDHGGPMVQIFETKKGLEKLGHAVSLFERWQPIRRQDFDLVHIFTARYSTYHAAEMFRKMNLPIVTSPIFFTRHTARIIRTSLVIEKIAQRFGSGIWTNYGFTSRICSFSAAVLPNTIAEGKLISDGMAVPPGKITVVPNGVDSLYETGDPSLFEKTYSVKDFILNVGHIGPGRKNVYTLIRALNGIDHPAVIIGKVSAGPDGERCLNEAKKNKNILIIPGLEHDSPLLHSAYAACKVFALPSLFETPGIAALEAGLAGATIVLTPYGGTREYFGDHALYVEPGSIDSIRQGIVNALSMKRNDNLQRHIKNNFLWQTIAEKTEKVYENILGTL